jgi:hypothetical protein
MVAHPDPDVLIPALTWSYVAAPVTVHALWGKPTLHPGLRLIPAVDGSGGVRVVGTGSACCCGSCA